MGFFSVAFPAHSGPWPLIQFRNHFFTDGRTPWASHQPVARPLPTHRTTQTQNRRTHTDIDALNGIRTHDPTFRASEGNSCLRPRGHCDRHSLTLTPSIMLSFRLSRFFVRALCFTHHFQHPWCGWLPRNSSQSHCLPRFVVRLQNRLSVHATQPAAPCENTLFRVCFRKMRKQTLHFLAELHGSFLLMQMVVPSAFLTCISIRNTVCYNYFSREKEAYTTIVCRRSQTWGLLEYCRVGKVGRIMSQCW
jgi:hypothetical protein